jgi:methylthioribose-1-phosphate isomerase
LESIFWDISMRTVEWDYDLAGVKLIDQRLLPGELKVNFYQDHHQVVGAIRDMVVRGAPAIGVTAAFGLALAAFQSSADTPERLMADLQVSAQEMRESRPTAHNLTWALDRILNGIEASNQTIGKLRIAILELAQALADDDVRLNQQMARLGAVLIADGDTIIHHCNTGALAAVDWGTALGVIRMAFEQGRKVHVLVDETRPRLQGARLTAWELKQVGIPYDIITDNAAGYFLSTGQVQKVFFGADRVAANGDVVNKIGTYMLALAAHDNHVPVYAVVPSSTIDLSLANGRLVPIEQRNPAEVLDLEVAGQPVTPVGSTARNPAFDITPNRLLTAIVTENGIIYPPFEQNLGRIVAGN